MFEQIEALAARLRRIEAWLRAGPQQEGVRFGEPVPGPVPTDDPAKAKAAYEAAQLEVKNQEERAKLHVKEAQDNEKRAKEILDKSEAEAKAQEQAEAKRQQEMAQHQQATQRVTPEPSDARRK